MARQNRGWNLVAFAGVAAVVALVANLGISAFKHQKEKNRKKKGQITAKSTAVASVPLDKGDHIGASAESVSSGRFISEGLTWEKWSAFSHNRYVEEAEKLSRPVAVAAKKAYFEAHFMRKAAERAAAAEKASALIQEANSSSSGTSSAETQDENRTNSSIEIKSKSDGNLAIIKQLDIDAGDPTGALEESVSFGRFISEGLAWENWSAFSRNCYVEEAEKLSRPISVAAKKAYFEAHFMRKAAERAAAAEKASALIQEANSSFSGTSSAETQDENRTNSSIEIKSKAIIEQLDIDAVEYEVFYFTDTNNYKCDIEQIEEYISRMERAQDMRQPCIDTNEHKCDIEQRVVDFSRPEDAPQPYTAANINMENSDLVDKSSQFDNVAVPKEERMPDQGTATQEKGSEMNSSTKLSSKTKTVKLSCSAERKAAGQATYKVNSALQIKKSVGASIKKRRSARSPHMSINLSSRVGETSNKASVSEHDILKRISPNLPRISKDLSVASRTSIGASSHASANTPSEGKRTSRLFNKSVSGAVTANGKFSLHSVDFLKSSSTTRGSTRSPTILSPFRFRSNERVAKRKEFFERMDEIKSKETEKMQLQRRYKVDIKSKKIMAERHQLTEKRSQMRQPNREASATSSSKLPEEVPKNR